MNERLSKLFRSPLVIIGIIIILLLAAIGFYAISREEEETHEPMEVEKEPLYLEYKEPYAFNDIGYEPSIASDSMGNLFYTAHKNVDSEDMDKRDTWDYLASWFYVSNDGGETWQKPGGRWQYYLGDEGDIGVDANDWVYYVDTYLRDINIHVFSNGGELEYSTHYKTSVGLDDRPWVTAHGDGIVHYLGNNAVSIGGGRYWYYRSTNAGITWSQGDVVPGNGWLHIDADRSSGYVYIVKEGNVAADQDITIHISDDYGASWDWNNPVYVGHRDGPSGPPGEGRWPVVSAGENGTVWVLWGDYEDAENNGSRLFLARSLDYGQTWNVTDITPFQGVHDYPWIAAGPDGSIGVAFYSTEDLPVDENSKWYIYGGMQLHADVVDMADIDINFSMADPTEVYIGNDYHALHDFFECCISPDGALNIAYQYYVGPGNGDSILYFVRGELPDGNGDEEEEEGE
ncbi:MAG: exo-alpha-sialidase [Thermoplasmata archaeon]|nr:MAG: exo-alpha-sialidase [Thermoplasmata archaeon]